MSRLFSTVEELLERVDRSAAAPTLALSAAVGTVVGRGEVDSTAGGEASAGATAGANLGASADAGATAGAHRGVATDAIDTILADMAAARASADAAKRSAELQRDAAYERITQLENELHDLKRREAHALSLARDTDTVAEDDAESAEQRLAAELEHCLRAERNARQLLAEKAEEIEQLNRHYGERIRQLQLEAAAAEKANADLRVSLSHTEQKLASAMATLSIADRSAEAASTTPSTAVDATTASTAPAPADGNEDVKARQQQQQQQQQQEQQQEQQQQRQPQRLTSSGDESIRLRRMADSLLAKQKEINDLRWQLRQQQQQHQQLQQEQQQQQQHIQQQQQLRTGRAVSASGAALAVGGGSGTASTSSGGVGLFIVRMLLAHRRLRFAAFIYVVVLHLSMGVWLLLSNNPGQELQLQ